MSNNVKFKVVILGTEGVGKTCLMHRIISDKFSDKYQATVAGVYRAKFFTSHGKSLQIGIWDTVGTERYKSMNQLFYRGAKAAIICYDICERNTWKDVKYWISELRLHEEDCKVYLCGTKKDLVTEGLRQREVDFKVTSKHAEGIQAKIVEVSSKTGDNVVDLFQMIVDDYVEAHENHDQMVVEESITLSPGTKFRNYLCCS